MKPEFIGVVLGCMMFGGSLVGLVGGSDLFIYIGAIIGGIIGFIAAYRVSKR